MNFFKRSAAAVALSMATATVAVAQAPVTPSRNPNDLTQSQDQLRTGQNNATNPTGNIPPASGIPGSTRDSDQRLTNPSANPATAGSGSAGSQAPTPQSQAGSANPKDLPSQGSAPRGN